MSTTTTTPSALGPLIRLRGLRTSQLPAPDAPSPAELAPLLRAILQEALPFIDSAAPKAGSGSGSDGVPGNTQQGWRRRGAHRHTDSAAEVEVLERVVRGKELERALVQEGDEKGAGEEEKGKEKGTGKGKGKVRDETWCCRRSLHADKPEKGTASWAEFVRSFRDEHAETERAFTPACVGAWRAWAWDCGGVNITTTTTTAQTQVSEGEGGGGETWGRFSLVVEEMRHRIGRPVLRDRTFPVLQMTATRISGGEGEGEGGEEEEEEEFVVVSIPVPDFGDSEMSQLAREKDAQVARYVSVERIRRIKDRDGDGDGDGGKVEWLMATASDAGGVLPAWVQNMAAPGVIWKDVPLFLGWIAKERGKRQGKEAGTGSGTGSRTG
ncbi:uncharacterized protein F4812DRAFT_351230 [Daldinia caldariorum]|uniref:uncharacterized protein n=1 Tax=Daldinia caldariorum TaxID=326644 RepID=UPI0020088A75|nr:uncharacterized protein F4812DRAFT_351230 [Daldinia caldariorum]KAI1468907.1 hypothetical protein F4812DRAFT_351230 [Daldinia caldariorum]